MDLINDIPEPKPAPIGWRILSGFIDFLSFWIMGFIMGMFFGKLEQTVTGIGVSISGTSAFILFLLWFPLIPISEGLTGQTLGKRICNIKVIRLNSAPTNILLSLLRHFFDVIDLIIFIGIILIATTKKRQRIGDLVTGTYVVSK
jgi:uncharacterized RDD family membrane protein YckC